MKALVALLCLSFAHGCTNCEELSPIVTKTNTPYDILIGIYQGLQEDVYFKSACVNRIESVPNDFQEFTQQLTKIFTNFTQDVIFETIDSFYYFTYDLEGVVLKCKLTTLTDAIRYATSEEGMPTVKARLATNATMVSVKTFELSQYIMKGDYLNMGRVIGQLMSIALNFKLQSNQI